MRLATKDAARLLDVPVETISRWIRQGKIPARREKGDYFFIKSELELWARNHNIHVKPFPTYHSKDENQEEITLLEAMKRGGDSYTSPPVSSG